MSNQINLEMETRNINSKYDTSSIFCIILLLLVIIIIILYVIYTIIGLANLSYHDQLSICPESNIWLFELLSLVVSSCIVPLYFYIMTSSKKLSPANAKLSDILFTVAIIIFMWGFFELISVNCLKKLNNTILSNMLHYNVIGTTAVFFALLTHYLIKSTGS